MADLMHSRKMSGCAKISAQKVIETEGMVSSVSTVWIVAAGGLGVGEESLDTVEILELGDRNIFNFDKTWSTLGRLQTPRYHFPTVGVLPNKGCSIFYII